jgi:hypothetical protein
MKFEKKKSINNKAKENRRYSIKIECLVKSKMNNNNNEDLI